MTYEQLRIFNATKSLTNIECNLANSINSGKAVVDRTPPYKLIPIITDRDHYDVIFSNHFLTVFREALSYDTIAKMNDKEKEVWFDFVDYSNGTMDPIDVSKREKLQVVQALDDYCLYAVMCESEFTARDTQGYFDITLSNPHTWVKCDSKY